MKIIEIDSEKYLNLLRSFLDNAGDSLRTFRYFSKRQIDSINTHLVTYIGLNEKEEPICYGHLDAEDDKVWLGVCVIEREKGKGYGNMMVDKLLEYAGKMGLNQINLSVDNDNLIAKKIYNKKGFKLIKKTDQISYYLLDLREL